MSETAKPALITWYSFDMSCPGTDLYKGHVLSTKNEEGVKADIVQWAQTQGHTSEPADEIFIWNLRSVTCTHAPAPCVECIWKLAFGNRSPEDLLVEDTDAEEVEEDEGFSWSNVYRAKPTDLSWLDVVHGSMAITD